ncbi:MAG TPA: aspartate aminotransferase [Algoriphagus sp.]|jgi:aspartate aminotransferase|uniref:pyridoxal phosphate-dependent aminotransferase n=1 Tax=unclassified Algoriphagus TaxID=2641541 RepID=UPI000C3FF95A|nr:MULTISPECIES: pyridoxal phosphate-dependent aminotransferase [unclassified Algoriphagus]MAL13156.1 aspartate aminotransferase [Algoriphagus sp.]MAN87265.1 aspartate aminotransferase [Algoriphagus sp.]QYH41095.1 pyridoxal phosphate-dependent aminotransferase [Algoriphagus sp. NBT04N3]HAD49823.1 aspartate aminotransferase [Algoriphagus sp.]HAS60925.1 aspartate aminotransferase [Algoriphagus sp.]
MNSILSDRILNMEESATLAMAKKARELKSQGIDIIGLSLGEPDFKTPKHIQEAAKSAIDEGKYFSYPPVAGYQDLREALAKKLRDENNISEAKAENIVVSTGAKHSIANTFMCLLNEGDEVVIFSPYWVSYAEIIKLAGGVPILIEGTLGNNFKATAAQLEDALTDKTKAVIYSSPCNPTGSVFSQTELEAIAAVIKKKPNLMVIADEIYELINFTGKNFSIASLPGMFERTITVNGFSKGYAMTGWRVGYICAPVEIAKAVEKIQGQFTSGGTGIAQRAALAAIAGDQTPSKDMAEAYFNRRQIVLDLLKEIPGIKTHIPEGAFYFFPDVTAYFGKSAHGHSIKDADDLCLYLLDVAHVSLVTGGAFGAPNCVRLSYAASEDELKEAMKRIKKALAELA